MAMKTSMRPGVERASKAEVRAYIAQATKAECKEIKGWAFARETEAEEEEREDMRNDFLRTSVKYGHESIEGAIRALNILLKGKKREKRAEQAAASDSVQKSYQKGDEYWSGRGRPPKWVVAELLNHGYTYEDCPKEEREKILEPYLIKHEEREEEDA